ncbi:F-box/LRR-repeat protein 2-like [Protopterus annectens]|uniref:F-box/LRR-repeat protein 2-like n=1 Tax=Protopterus annectens TaxID=7888 RepID=UPI001CFA2E5B|nr:F-box/LRR-repeat protein 2-like [Protopterus annectens]
MAKKHGKRLKSLEVFGCHALTAPCMTYMARECPNLQILNMGRLPKITDTCLAQMMSNLKSLRSLNVTGLTVIRDRVLHHIVRQCPKLERLTISSCPLLTDVSLIEISTYLQTIQYLDVSGCKKVTDTGVQALAMSCHQLQYLDLSSTETGHRGVCLLASYCKNLECVKLSFCKEISQDAVKKLCKSCIKLKLLHLYGCRTMYDLKAIKDTNKNVKVHHDLSVHSSHQA